MKKIITSSAILLGACLFANTATAQLASDQPSQAAQAVAASKASAASAIKAVEVQTASSSASTRAVVANPAKIVVTDVPASSATPVAVPSQGEEKAAPAVVAPKVVEQPKMQSNSAPAKKEE